LFEILKSQGIIEDGKNKGVHGPIADVQSKAVHNISHPQGIG
jgi:hypothetical protein